MKKNHFTFLSLLLLLAGQILAQNPLSKPEFEEKAKDLLSKQNLPVLFDGIEGLDFSGGFSIDAPAVGKISMDGDGFYSEKVQIKAKGGKIVADLGLGLNEDMSLKIGEVVRANGKADLGFSGVYYLDASGIVNIWNKGAQPLWDGIKKSSSSLWDYVTDDSYKQVMSLSDLKARYAHKKACLQMIVERDGISGSKSSAENMAIFAEKARNEQLPGFLLKLLDASDESCVECLLWKEAEYHFTQDMIKALDAMAYDQENCSSRSFESDKSKFLKLLRENASKSVINKD